MTWDPIYIVLFVNVMGSHLHCIIRQCYGIPFTLYYSSMSWDPIYIVLFANVMGSHLHCIIRQCHGIPFILYTPAFKFLQIFWPDDGLHRPKLVAIYHWIVVFDEVYILFHFNIILKHNGMSSTKSRELCWVRHTIVVTLYSRIPLIRSNWDGEPFGYPENSDNWIFLWKYATLAVSGSAVTIYRGADKSLTRPTSRCILLDGENISFDASLVIYINK